MKAEEVYANICRETTRRAFANKVVTSAEIDIPIIQAALEEVREEAAKICENYKSSTVSDKDTIHSIPTYLLDTMMNGMTTDAAQEIRRMPL